jgi:transposase
MTKRQRRTFSSEFKIEAARSLDVGETALRRWVEQLKLERGGTTPTTKTLTPEQQNI